MAGVAITEQAQSLADQNSDECGKLRLDLEAVFERVRLCREILPNSPGAVVDFDGFVQTLHTF